MKKILTTIAIAITCIMSACSDKVVFEEKHNFPNSTWMRIDPENFEETIKNIADCYDTYFSLTVDTNVIRINNLPLVINIEDSEGSLRVFMSDIIFQNKKGESMGKTIGSFVEYTAKAREYFYFNSKGIHKFSIKNSTQFYELKGIASIGMKIEKSNMDINIE